MLQSVPPYVRVHRIQRDIPASQIVAGCQRSNLYELVMRYMEQNGMNCRCIRCREVGYRPGKVTMITPHEQRYRSSEGIEYFLSLEGDNDSIISYLRLRFDQNATVRELRTVGRVVGIDRSGSEFQHRGGGRQLLQRAEELSKLEGYPRLRVISGIGVREYYQKLGYVLDRIEDPGFMIKTLNT